ncbi:hypothetical protein [Halorientalis salina]|uniref:hypothetical protein n=1 Tax=Halorientalis salina TaxID=2932266 RepID=UPI0010AC0581|nr:hypothetical protein [Halorientalis salina]
MRRGLRIGIVLVLALSIAGAGCSALTGNGTPTPANETTSRTPATVTPTTPQSNTTATPEENASESPAPGNNTTRNESGESLPKYAAMMSDILRSDDTNMSSLDLPGENSTTLHSSQIEIKSVELEPYGNESNNDTRLRVEYYNTEDGLNEIRVAALAYTHAMNNSLQSDEILSFDEVDVISYQNRTSTEPAARVKIDGAWVLKYIEGAWNGESFLKSITATASEYKYGNFGPSPYNFKQRLEKQSPENVSIVRVEEYGAMVFVDYSTVTHPKNTDKRMNEMIKILETYSKSDNKDEFSSGHDIYNSNTTIGPDLYLEERYVENSNTHDVKTWQIQNSVDTSKIATNEMSYNEVSLLIEDRLNYESNILGK